MSDWVYHTEVKPKKEEVNSDYKNEFESSFTKFINECKISKDVLDKYFLDEKIYYLEIDISDDVINKNSNYHVSFLKSKFIVNPRFKRELIDYYNPIGYFINGPIKREENTWVLEIKKKISF